ncbi:uncharacterized protein LOC129570644 [Sitodiplosis mosellana]|uniref:uncharacterized protein LOC129570644 n=1 Tax=Sitodiplosis mosellana TaxID=263140 RepID=UPI0024445CC7|nr:uncharacterized protein LOC129570644 [Sitodiplosis mosellana]
MKFAVFVILACLSVALVNTANPPKITTWGQVTSRTLGTKNVVATSSILQIKTFKFTFPEGQGTNTIFGIQHFDFKSHPVSVRFLKGGIGQRNVTLQIDSQRGHGINSTFIFYTN